MRSCNGCVHQMEDGRPGIRADGFVYIRYEDVKSICDNCYAWNSSNQIRVNYKEDDCPFSKRNMNKYLKNVFKDF